MTPRDLPWRAVEGGLELRVKAHPRARRPGLQGLVPGVDGPRIKAAVNEAAEDGRANRAILALLAEELGLAPSRLSVTAGAASREKTVLAEGDPAALAARLAERLA